MANNPTLLVTPIAENGTKNALPLNQSSPGQMSQDTGFPPETSLPLGAGGVAPSREDFNGAFNLLGGVAFYAQKGFSFNYDSAQDYYAGCVVIDAADGKRYQCIANMTAGTVSPSNDTTHTYWKEYTIDNLHTIGAFNKKETFTTSGSYTAPVTGVYRITLQGGGGGGSGAGYGTQSLATYTGAGGGSGAHIVFYETLTAGTSYSYTIGAGGAGGAAGSASSPGAMGTDGGGSSIVINENTYVSGGGRGGRDANDYARAGNGGAFFLNSERQKLGGGFCGMPGSQGTRSLAESLGGGAGNSYAPNMIPYQGKGVGGPGGGISSSQNFDSGGAGGDGYITFEYYDPTI